MIHEANLFKRYLSIEKWKLASYHDVCFLCEMKCESLKLHEFIVWKKNTAEKRKKRTWKSIPFSWMDYK